MNFIAIGRSSGECIFIHKEDLELLLKFHLTHKVLCIAIDFDEKRISTPVIIDVLLKFCPHYEINSEGEQSVINDVVLNTFSDSELDRLNNRFERIKYSSQIERDTELQY